MPETDKKQGLGVFFQAGFPERDRNQTGLYLGGGLHYIGLLPQRESDTLSLGVAAARNGRDYRNVETASQIAETTIELTYRVEVTPYFSLQPDIQYVVNPGTDPELGNACVLGLRTELGF